MMPLEYDDLCTAKKLCIRLPIPMQMSVTIRAATRLSLAAVNSLSVCSSATPESTFPS